MPQKSAQAQPADTRIYGPINDIAINNGPISSGEINDGAINGIAINGMTATTKTILAFAREIAQMSRQALDRTTRHIERLRKAHSVEEVASIQIDFVKESLEHAVQHTRKVCEMLATFPLEMTKTYHQVDWLQSANVAIQTTGEAGHAAAAIVERLSHVPRRT